MTPEMKKANDGNDRIGSSGLSFCQIKEIMSLMNQEGITDFRMDEGENRLRIKRKSSSEMISAESDSRFVLSERCPSNHNRDGEPKSAESKRTGHIVTSPVVGVFYDTPAPEQPPYVEVGSFVNKGDVLCIIEAMKLMNEVTSPVTGTIKEILVLQASRVEFGQELFVIDPSEKKESENE